MAANVADDMRDRLMADGVLAATLSGGVHVDEAGAWPLHPERPDAPYEDASGMARLKPCAVITESSVVPVAPTDSGQRIVVRIGYYAPDDYGVLRRAAERTRYVLDPDGHGEQHGPLDDGRYYIVRFLDAPIRAAKDDQVISADAEGGVCYEAARYQVDIDWPE